MKFFQFLSSNVFGVSFDKERRNQNQERDNTRPQEQFMRIKITVRISWVRLDEFRARDQCDSLYDDGVNEAANHHREHNADDHFDAHKTTRPTLRCVISGGSHKQPTAHQRAAHDHRSADN